MNETLMSPTDLPVQPTEPVVTTPHSNIPPDFLRKTFTDLHEITVLAGNFFVDGVAKDLAVNPNAAIDETRNFRISEGKYDRWFDTGHRGDKPEGRILTNFERRRMQAAVQMRHGVHTSQEFMDTVMTGRASEYVVGETASVLDYDEKTLRYIAIPVGEYGKEFAVALARATAYMFKEADRGIRPEVSKFPANLEDTVAYMVRGRDIHRQEPIDGVIATNQEGALSVAQAIALLTAEKIPGYDDPISLVKALADSNVIAEFTRIVPSALVGPSAFSGRYIPGLVEVKDGTLQLNERVAEALRTSKKEQAISMLGKWSTYFADIGNGETPKIPDIALGVVCPAATPSRDSRGVLKRGGAVEQIGDTMSLILTETPLGEKGKITTGQATTS